MVDTFDILGSRFNQASGQGFPGMDTNQRVALLTGGEMDILGVFRKVFGYRGVPSGINGTLFGKSEASPSVPAVDGTDFGLKVLESKKATIESILGTPIFQPLYIDNWLFPNEPLITITGAKKLIETASAGGVEEVIEHIATSHYQIRIQGLLVNMVSDDSPDDEIRKIRSLYEARQSLEIVSPLLSLFDIHFFAFKTISWPAVEGHQAMQGYEITGRSDKIVSASSLIIKKPHA